MQAGYATGFLHRHLTLLTISLGRKGCKGIPWTAVVLMSCGTLTKGPVGSIFPCMCIGIYQLIRGRSFGKTFLSLFGIGLLSLIPLGIWFYAAWLQGGQPFMDLMLEENTGRFVGKMSYPSHHNPLWYNFLTIIWGWTPWTLVLLISLFGLKWNEMHLLPAGNSFTGRIRKVWDNIRSQSPIQLFIWIVIIAILSSIVFLKANAASICCLSIHLWLY